MALLDAMALRLALEGPGDLGQALARQNAMRARHRAAYQALSAWLTPFYQSHSRALPLMRDHLLAPMSRLPGVSHLLTALVSGDLLPPLAGRRWPAWPSCGSPNVRRRCGSWWRQASPRGYRPPRREHVFV